MSYTHLTISERLKIEAYLAIGMKVSKIAEQLDVHRSTISREVSRCNGDYNAHEAQNHYNQKAKAKGRKSCCTDNLREVITEEGASMLVHPSLNVHMK